MAWSANRSNVLSAVTSMIAPLPRLRLPPNCYFAFTLDVIDAITLDAFELVIAVLDPMSSCDPVEIGIGGPDLAPLAADDATMRRSPEWSAATPNLNTEWL
jgi:hypothetical protein